MTTYEITMDNGCTFHCIAWTPTTLFGANVFGGVGDAASPYSAGYANTFVGASSSGTDLNASLGVNLGVQNVIPVQFSARLDCTTSGEDDDGCPCEDSEPPNIVGGT